MTAKPSPRPTTDDDELEALRADIRLLAEEIARLEARLAKIEHHPDPTRRIGT